MVNRFAAAQSGVATRRWGPPMVTLAAIAALMALTGSATAKQARPAQSPKEATAPREHGEPTMAIVSINYQQVTF